MKLLLSTCLEWSKVLLWIPFGWLHRQNIMLWKNFRNLQRSIICSTIARKLSWYFLLWVDGVVDHRVDDGGGHGQPVDAHVKVFNPRFVSQFCKMFGKLRRLEGCLFYPDNNKLRWSKCDMEANTAQKEPQRWCSSSRSFSSSQLL